MIVLKDYQQRVLDSLREFLQRCSTDRQLDAAFQAIQIQNGRNPIRYLPVSASGLAEDMPYVCLRVPTGGGKTLLACHAAGIAMEELLHAEHAMVLWLVPSNTILDQTADALRDPRHDYRRALELACGAVEVVTIDEALRLSRATVDGQTVVIVATIQSFRVEDITGRKVYDQNGTFSEHLLNIPSGRYTDLFPGADGKPKPSLVNMLRLRRPIVIVDEAHNARTDLSFTTLGNVSPSCIIEFTATPARKTHPSNVLHHVSASELKAAEMIKLPLRVIRRDTSQRDELLVDAINLRDELEKLAEREMQTTGEYLRPIMLIQAERVDACEPLRKRLVSDFGLSEEQIKISVGKLDELKGIDAEEIKSPRCPIRYIITVEKLREGWDCPFAYVLCSVKETRSATAIEQIVGRILRLPGARTKRNPDLNCAYAFSVSHSLPEVLNELREALVSNGFTNAEAERIIIPEAGYNLVLGVQPQTVQVAPGEELDIETVQAQVDKLEGKVKVDIAAGAITVFVPLDTKESELVVNWVKTPEAKAKVVALVETVKEAALVFEARGQQRTATPYDQQLDFRVPLLCVEENGSLFEFESTFLLEHPWKLSEKDASLPGYNPYQRPQSESGILDIGTTGNIEVARQQMLPYETDFVDKLHQHVFQLSGTEAWTLENLVVWLDRHIDHQDIPIGESAAFLRNVIRGLTTRFEIKDLSVLARDRFRLRDAIDHLINQHRLSERKIAFQQLLSDDSALTIHDEYSINFKDIYYAPSSLYSGGFIFTKHYFGPKPGELEEKTQGGRLAEEFECAQYLDGMAEIEYWIRNLSRKPTSFRLQTSTDKFYPDFLCKLYDGRILAVEYKGADRFSAIDAEEKRIIGKVWESRSGGRCLFVMPTDRDFSVIDKAII